MKSNYYVFNILKKYKENKINDVYLNDKLGSYFERQTLVDLCKLYLAENLTYYKLYLYFVNTIDLQKNLKVKPEENVHKLFLNEYFYIDDRKVVDDDFYKFLMSIDQNLISFRLLAFNDLHGQVFLDKEYVNGTDMFQHILEEKKRRKHIFVFDVGDSFFGSANCKKENNMILYLMNYVGVNIHTPGNHDYDFGIETYENIIKDASFNIIFTDTTLTNKIYFKEKIFYIEDYCLKIKSYMTNDIEKEIKTSCKYLNDEQGLTILLAHEGYYLNDEKQLITKSIQNFDVIFGGHKHYNKIIKDNNTVYISTEGKGEYVSVLDVYIDKNKNKYFFPSILKIQKSISYDSEIVQIVNKHQELNREVMFYTAIPIEGHSWRYNKYQIIRDGMTPLGVFFTKILNKIQKTDITILNVGLFRDEITVSGPVTYEKLYNIFSLGNQIVRGYMDVNTLKSILETPDKYSGRLCTQVYGIKYKWNPNNNIGQKIKDIITNEGEFLVKNGEVVSEKIFSISTTEYLANYYGDGYTGFKNMEKKEYCGDMFQMLEQYFMEHNLIEVKNIKNEYIDIITDWRL
ncbi:TPA: hypothetical protein I1871_001675 [Staphylococcus pseudintermedius]|nr:5'-nucleotidase C-terminal domain-containing protein [Staphylococcus pseudintermedius]EJD8521219.1 5'-nucleotidase C-terminal domain-containing protein [Staphylococcus pseudintermedius]HAR6574032.1 hypothetical protein [Staphylococcus pseudintermedius]